MDLRWQAAVLVLLAGVVVAGCSAPLSHGRGGHEAGSGSSPLLGVDIAAEPPEYSLMMSSTPGIRLTARNTTGTLPPGAEYRWEASFGHFLSWSEPSYRVIPLGPVTRQGPDAVYWSYDPLPPDQDPPEVTVTLTVTEPATGAVLAQGTLRITWKDRQTAVVWSQS
jgi:hypothetical protein